MLYKQETIPFEEFTVNPAVIRARLLTEFCRQSAEYVTQRYDKQPTFTYVATNLIATVLHRQKEDGTGGLWHSTRTKVIHLNFVCIIL